MMDNDATYVLSEDPILEEAVITVEEEQDPLLAFIAYARSFLSPEGEDENSGNETDFSGPGWSWIMYRILKTCIAYSSGVTTAILLSDLFQAWNEQYRASSQQKRPEIITQLRKNHRRKKLPNTVTIDSIYKKNFLSLTGVLEAVVINVFLLPGTNIYMLSLGDFWSTNTIDLYLHRRYYSFVDPNNGLLKKGREIFLTGCHLRSAIEGSDYLRLLPTEYLVVLLDEDKDDDAMLLGAQFCSDYFSSISLDAVSKGASYSLYARIESIGPLEIQGKFSTLKRKQITLVDSDGMKLKFLLWGDQVVLANIFSVGSMLALDSPFVASSEDTNIEGCTELCLEFGSATQLYLVPFIQLEEQVSVTQNLQQGSRLLTALDPSHGPKVSQITLPCDCQGSVDFSNYPFQSFVVDLHDKMTGICLYGVVIDIIRERSTTETIFSLKIKDSTGSIWAKLLFANSWSLGRLGLGHMVYVSGLTCSRTKQKPLELTWVENDAGAFLVNISCLPALLSSSCLHKLSNLSDLSSQTCGTRICRVWLDEVEYSHVYTKLSHTLCGHFVKEAANGLVECYFCNCACDAEFVIRTFHLNITLADDTAKVFAWCTGETATELLQISPDDFCELPEEEQMMYPSSLENEKFTVALVNCKTQANISGDGGLSLECGAIMWEITRALKCE